MKLHVLVIDGVFDIGLSSVLDIVGTANELALTLESPPAPIEVTLVGLRKKVLTSHGLSVPVRAVSGVDRPDAVIVPALGAKMPAPLVETLARRDVADAQGVLREWSQDDAAIGAACTGTFVLADAALLDGHSATTSWWLAPLFRQRSRQVDLDESRMLVSSTPFITAGAALAHVDLALGLVRRQSPTLAALTARYLLIEPRASQAAFVIPDHLAHTDPVVERFERWARQNLAHGFSLSDAARNVGASERTLARRLQKVLGKSPLSYVQDLRVERAIHLLQSSHERVEQIAAAVG
ncbi:MAG: helix-turn-helix domain protein [Rhizobacter sp.]|nr:helix-turn-helix domain protein [Rhizobacter sp.]